MSAEEQGVPSDGAPRKGSSLGPFRLEERRGKGSFKIVYAARNDAGDVRYPERVAVSIPDAQDEEARRLLENELRVIETLRHPAIVQAYGIEEDRGWLFLVLELVEGIPLDRKLREGGPLALREAVEIIRQAGEALDYAHDGMAIHRDVKPGNIMLLPDGRVKLLDFGLARLLGHSRHRASSRVGSTAYMAPEQYHGTTGMNADLWSLGVTFHELITGSLPFPGQDDAELMRHILYEAPDLGAIEKGGFDKRLVRVMRKVLEKDPEKRYRRAAELVADLDAVLRHASAVNDVESQIEIHLRSHCPLLCIQSHEEERVLASLRRVRDAMAGERPARPFDLFTWSETRGLEDQQGRPVASGTVGNPVAALEHVIQAPSEGIYVFLDIHRHFTPPSVRLVRDAIWTVKRKRKSLIFLSPVASVPEELRADATLFFYEPPDLMELQALIDALQRELAGDGGEALEGGLRETVARAVLGLTRREAERVLRRAALRHGGLNRDCLAEALAQKEQIVRKEGLLQFCKLEVSLADVGGLDLLKEWFALRRQAFTSEGRRFGLRAPRGAVLLGVPGCGKSLAAKALASSWDVPLLRLDVGRLLGKYVGQAEANLRRALATAEHVSPCVLWIDELEKSFGVTTGQGDSGVIQRLFGSFLTWLEEHQAPVFLVATANDVTGLPPELLRSGRFDERFFVDLPGPRGRREILDIHLRRRAPHHDGFDLESLIKASPGFSGAELEEAIVSGLFQAFEAGRRPLATRDVLDAVAGTVPLSRARPEDVMRLRAWAKLYARPAQREDPE